MKRILPVLTIILLVAVGYLYYLHFSTPKAPAKPSAAQRISDSGLSAGKSLIAYVDLDTMNERIEYIKKVRKDLEVEQKSIEAEWENSYRSLERQKNEFLKKGSSITEQMAQEFQANLLQQQDKVDSRKQEMTQKVSERHYKMMDDIQKKLKDFLNEYNKDKNFSYILMVGSGLEYIVYKDSALNITDDIVEGMNAKLKSGKN